MEPISNDHNDKKELYLEKKTQKIHVDITNQVTESATIEENLR